MPTLDHEAPLAVLREEPALVPALLREVLHIELPPFTTADLDDPTATQPLPVSYSADLVVTLRGSDPDHRPVMGIIIEVQRSCDSSKHRSWPLYAAALHARLACQICLVVIATDDAVARWAASPIHTVQAGSPFVPLVIGPDQFPRVSRERACHEPWMAALSALAHGNRPYGAPITIAALTSIASLPGHHARLLIDLIFFSLNHAARRALEQEMETHDDSSTTSFYDRIIHRGLQQGLQQGRLHATRSLLLGSIERRFGAASDSMHRSIDGCSDLERLTHLFYEIGVASDRETIERLTVELELAQTAPCEQ